MQPKSSRVVSFLIATLCGGIFIGLSGCGRSETGAPAPAPAAPVADATFSDKGVTIGGKLISLPCTEKEITAVLGAPSRKVDMPKANTIFVWDDKGILAYFRPGTDDGHSVDIVLRPQHFPFSPKTVFAHNIIVGGKTISANSSAADLKAAGFATTPPITFVWQRAEGKIEVDIATDPASNEITDISAEVPKAP